MQFFGKEVNDIGKAEQTVINNIKIKIDKLLQAGTEAELLNQPEITELDGISKNIHTRELTNFRDTLIKINNFWKLYLPKLAGIRAGLEKGGLLKNRNNFAITNQLVNNAVQLFEDIKREIYTEENQEFNIWDMTVGKASLENMAQESEGKSADEANAALNLLETLESHATRLKKWIDLAYTEFKDLQNYLHTVQ